MRQALAQEQPKIILRKANQDDAKFLFNLRNDSNAYKWFSNPNPVKWEDHLVWLNDVLSDRSKKHLYLIKLKDDRVGQLRFDEVQTTNDKKDKKAIVNISLLASQRGKGLGSASLRQGIELAKKMGVQMLIAEIHQDNVMSIGLFQKMGFIFQGQKDVWQTFVLKI